MIKQSKSSNNKIIYKLLWLFLAEYNNLTLSENTSLSFIFDYKDLIEFTLN